MAYVAMSRVRTLEGLHLTAFDPRSIIVNNSCLEEVNRLRSSFRKDLPLYEIPEQKKQPVKRNLLDEEAPAYKCETEPKAKRPRSSYIPKSAPSAKKRKVTDDDKDCEVTAVHRPAAPRSEWTDYRYYPVDEAWQRIAWNTICTTISTTRWWIRHGLTCVHCGRLVVMVIAYSGHNFRFRSSTWRITKSNRSTYEYYTLPSKWNWA